MHTILKLTLFLGEIFYGGSEFKISVQSVSDKGYRVLNFMAL